MRPDAAVTYLPVQNTVADDFLRLIEHTLKGDGGGGTEGGGGGEIDDILPLVTRYTTEGLDRLQSISFTIFFIWLKFLLCKRRLAALLVVQIF